MGIFDITEEQINFREKANPSLSHLVGSRDEDILTLPNLNKSIQKEARRDFSEREKFALIEEDGQASNADRLDIKGTHYESQSAAEIAMSILPLMGLSSKSGQKGAPWTEHEQSSGELETCECCDGTGKWQDIQGHQRVCSECQGSGIGKHVNLYEDLNLHDKTVEELEDMVNNIPLSYKELEAVSDELEIARDERDKETTQ